MLFDSKDKKDRCQKERTEFNSIHFIFITVPSQQPDAQLQKQNNIDTHITKEINGTYHTNKTNRKRKSLMTHYNN
jgi:mannitol-1-phosphate/altronate dehydrogenase